MAAKFSFAYGIGVRVLTFPSVTEFPEGMEEYLDTLLTGTTYDYFVVGNTFLDTEKYYIVLNDADIDFASGMADFSTACENLLAFLLQNEVDFEGNVRLIGGLHVC